MIVKITENEIFYYSDYTFMMFNCNSLITGAETIGVAWPVGKCKIPHITPTDIIKKDTCYHNGLMLELIDIARKAIPRK